MNKKCRKLLVAVRISRMTTKMLKTFKICFNSSKKVKFNSIEKVVSTASGDLVSIHTFYHSFITLTIGIRKVTIHCLMNPQSNCLNYSFLKLI